MKVESVHEKKKKNNHYCRSCYSISFDCCWIFDGVNPTNQVNKMADI